MSRVLRLLIATGLVWLVTLVAGPPAQAGQLPATGQTIPSPAETNAGVGGAGEIPDDGTLQYGLPLRYQRLRDGTVQDLSTGLIWEVKCQGCGNLHEVNNTYAWSGAGPSDTIWDWLEALNAEGGQGYAGHNDWRIPNVRELQSIVDYGRVSPAIDPLFGPTAQSSYWSSTTSADLPSFAWGVTFGSGGSKGGYVGDTVKSNPLCVRAVRGEGGRTQ